LNYHDFDWLRINNKGVLELDFYIPDVNIAIECQGRQHFEPVRWNYNLTYEEIEEQYNGVVERDSIKKSLCDLNGITLLYINYNDNIETKFQEILDIINSH
jgi:hypothetical protein